MGQFSIFLMTGVLLFLLPVPHLTQLDNTNGALIPWSWCNDEVAGYAASFCLGAVNNVLSAKNQSCFREKNCDLFLVVHYLEIGTGGENRYNFEVFANISGSKNTVYALEEVSWIQMIFSKTKIESFSSPVLYTQISEGSMQQSTDFPRLSVYVNTKSATRITLPRPGATPEERSMTFEPLQSYSSRFMYPTKVHGLPVNKYYRRFIFVSDAVVETDFRKVANDPHPPYHINFKTDAVFPYVIQYKEKIVRQRVRTQDGSEIDIYNRQPNPVTKVGNILRVGKSVVLLTGAEALDEQVTNVAVPTVSLKGMFAKPAAVVPRTTSLPKVPDATPIAPTSQTLPPTTTSGTIEVDNVSQSEMTTSTSNEWSPTSPEGKKGYFGIVLIIAVVIGVILVLCVMAYCMYRRRKPQLRSTSSGSLTRRSSITKIPDLEPDNTLGFYRSEIQESGVPSSWVYAPDARSAIESVATPPLPHTAIATTKTSTFKQSAEKPVHKLKSGSKTSPAKGGTVRKKSR